MIAIFDPCQANPGWWAKAMPPSWQYFLWAPKKADESIPDPKGANRGFPSIFPCKWAAS
jgi:hypothetical protein